MKSYRWFIITLAFLATIINYLDRTALSYAIAPLQEAYHLTNTDFGIIASGFGVGYLVMTIIGGVLVDNYGPRKIWTFFAIIWSIACASIGLATGFFSLFFFRMLLGFTEGPNFPAMTRVAADWLPVKERARALAFGLAAVPFASVVGAPFISHLVAMVGWRVMFIVLGAIGLIWAMAWFTLFRNSPQESRHVSKEELSYIQKEHGSLIQKTKTSWRFMLSNKTLLINNYAFFAFGYLLFFAITWLPGYLEQTYHMHIKNVGWFLVAPWLTATVFILAGGAISDWLWQKTNSVRISRVHIIWICQLLSVLCFIPLLFTHSIVITAFSITFGIAFGLMPNAAFYAINADLAFDRAATSLGIMDCAFALAGIMAPLLTGWLSHMTGNFSVAILLMMTLTLSSALLVAILGGKQ